MASSSALSSDTVITSDSFNLINVNMANVTKLTDNTFLMWSRQVHALLDGYGLAGYIDGSLVAPPSTLTTDGVTTENREFTKWKRQDKLIYSALLGAISTTVQPLLSTVTTSAGIWEILTSTYANPSRGHILQIRSQIQNWKKGTKSINEYFRGLSTRFDQLALLESPYSREDQIDLVMKGLPADYRQVHDQISGRDVAPSLPELYEKLINHEVRLSNIVSADDSLPITANAAQHRGNNNNNSRNNGGNYHGQQRNNNNRFNQTPQQQQQFRPRQDQNSRGYQGKCQICGIFGHSARRCSQLQQFSGGSLGSSSQYFPSQYSSSPAPWQPRAHMAATAYNPNNWILDSGATHHLTTDLNNLALHHPYNGGEEVTIADGSGLAISHTGSSTLSTPTRSLALTDILYVPNIHKNLISVYRLCNANKVSIEFFPAHFQVKDLNTGARLLQGKTKDELYEWPVKPNNIISYSASPTPKTSLPSWHSRLGHPSFSVLQTLVSQFSLPLSQTSQKQFPCSHCLINKSHKLPFYSNTISSKSPLDYVYTDVWTSPIVSFDNFKYYLILVDHYTRYTWFYPLQQKSQVKDTFIAFKSLVENRFQCKIRTLYSDNGGEFIALRPFLRTCGISHLTSPPHTPEHNGISERKHRHIVETGLTLMHQACVPTSYWSYAFATAVYLINRLPTHVLNDTSPYVKLFQQVPNYLKLRVFGCLCFPWLRPYTHHKLESRSVPCVFMGYSTTQSAFHCLDTKTGRIYTSRHVHFVEDRFPFSSNTSQTHSDAESNSSSQTPSSRIIPLSTAPLVSAPPSPPPSTDPHLPSTPSPAPVTTTDSPRQSSSSSAGTSSTPDNQSVGPGNNSIDSLTNSVMQAHSNPSPTSSQTNQNSSATETQPILSPTPSILSSPTHTHSSSSISANPQPAIASPPQNANNHPMRTRAKNNITKPITRLTLLAHPNKTKPYIPNTVNQAMRDQKWRDAMSEEINAQIRNNTFELVPPAPYQNVISTKWIFTLKYLPNGVLDRYKARLVARGFNQQYGIDYAETFSPVVKSTTIRTVLQLAVSRSWPIKQLDVNNAFLQGTLSEEVYVSQPPGFVDKDRPHYVCRLKKALYGLKQAPRAWYQELKTFLCTAGFQNSIADTSVFIYVRGSDIVYVLVYVDDIIVTGSSTKLITSFIDALAARFSLKDPKDLCYFLGIEATRTASGLHLMQRKYIVDLLVKTNMMDAKPVATPMAPNPKLTLFSGTPLDDPKEFRTVIGSLQYLAFTRPDIAYVVNRLSQFMHRPTDMHWQAVRRLLRYLAGTISHGIFLKANSPISLHTYSDADWAGDNDTYISTNAYILYLGMTPIAWSSKKQTGVARSSTEAEYRAVANTASEIIWVCSLLSELGVMLPTQPVVYCDNIGATYLSANPVFHSRMKHLAIDYHFVRNQVQSGALRVVHVSTNDQLADALTKPLPRPRFLDLFSKIGVNKLPPS